MYSASVCQRTGEKRQGSVEWTNNKFVMNLTSGKRLTNKEKTILDSDLTY